MNSNDGAEIEKLRQVAPTLLAPNARTAMPDAVPEDVLLGEALVQAGILSRDALDRAVEL